MKIALVGYGKMGKTIEQIALSKGHKIIMIIDQDNADDINKIKPENTDIAIEFSQPESALQNIKTLLNNKVKTLVGTTGWLEHYQEVVDLCDQTNGTFLYASNYSIGVNLFFELNEWLAEKMKNLSTFRPSMEEIHHIHKKDAPSGTAISLAEGLIKSNQQIDGWVNESTDKPNELSIISLREGEVPGTHTVQYDSPLESITITHCANDRKVFADGVIIVAEWATNQTGVLSIKDFLNSNS